MAMGLFLAVLAVTVPDSFQMPFVAEDSSGARAWQDAVRSRLFELVQAQHPRRDFPLDLTRGDLRDAGGYMAGDVIFTGNENTRITATLTIPKGAGPFPAVICLHGHGGNRRKVHDPGAEYHGLARGFAERGYVTLAPTLWHEPYAPNQLWNLMRLVDIVEAIPEVDKSRLGVAGLSMGGEWTMWLAACDLRIKAAVVSGWMCTTEGVLRVPNCPCWLPPGLLELCDIAEVHILIAPRPLLIESAVEDGCFPIDATDEGYAKLRKGYAVFGALDQLDRHTFPGGHAWNGGKAYPFMDKALKGNR